MDLTSFPILPDASPVDRRVDQLVYQTSISARRGLSLLIRYFNDLGFAIESTHHDDGRARQFVKNQVRFVCQVITTHNSSHADAARVVPIGVGNVDMSSLPMPGKLEERPSIFTTFLGTTSYFCAASPGEAVEVCADEIRKADWEPVDALRNPACAAITLVPVYEFGEWDYSSWTD